MIIAIISIVILLILTKSTVKYFQNKSKQNLVDVDFGKEFGANKEIETTVFNNEENMSDYAKELNALSTEDFIKKMEETTANQMRTMEILKSRKDVIGPLLELVNKYFYWIAFPVAILYLFFVNK